VQAVTGLRVLIAGGGLAGPLLAHGLLREGMDPVLLERDDGPDSRGQGYRISVAPDGTAALRACLPPTLYELAVATSGRRGSAVTILDPALRELFRTEFPEPPADDDGSQGLSVDRQTLRRILLAGLGDRIHLGAGVDGFEVGEGARVTARLHDGTTITGDVLVGADGSGSQVRARLAAGASVRETGQLLIFGKTPLDEESRRLAPPEAFDGFCTVVGRDGRFLPVAALEHRQDPAQAARRWPGLVLDGGGDYVMWVLGAPATSFRDGADALRRLEPSGLRELAAEMVADWHPNLASLLRHGDVATINAASIRSSSRPAALWPAGPVTLIGDAAHSMPPAGVGAAVALRDAGLLARRLAEAQRGERALVPAIRAYEEEMLEYAFAAVAEAERINAQLSPKR
jgi:2-polyprenyl-6-methoxyphenol hydroxylase-like FAD-dependent oxidoreductase